MMRLAAALLFTVSFAGGPVSSAQPAPPQPVITHRLEALADQPATHTGFTFDRSMMQVAQDLLQSNGMDAGHAAAAITGVIAVFFTQWSSSPVKVGAAPTPGGGSLGATGTF